MRYDDLSSPSSSSTHWASPRCLFLCTWRTPPRPPRSCSHQTPGGEPCPRRRHSWAQSGPPPSWRRDPQPPRQLRWSWPEPSRESGDHPWFSSQLRPSEIRVVYKFANIVCVKIIYISWESFYPDLDENSVEERDNPLGNGGHDRHDEMRRVRLSEKKSRLVNE